MRTNIEIDDELMQQALVASGAPTKKAAVEEALRLMVQLKGQGRISKLWGTVVWRGPDDDWFASDEEILAKRKQEEENTVGQSSSTLSPAAVEAVEETARR